MGVSPFRFFACGVLVGCSSPSNSCILRLVRFNVKSVGGELFPWGFWFSSPSLCSSGFCSLYVLDVDEYWLVGEFECADVFELYPVVDCSWFSVYCLGCGFDGDVVGVGWVFVGDHGWLFLFFLILRSHNALVSIMYFSSVILGLVHVSVDVPVPLVKEYWYISVSPSFAGYTCSVFLALSMPSFGCVLLFLRKQPLFVFISHNSLCFVKFLACFFYYRNFFL